MNELKRPAACHPIANRFIACAQPIEIDPSKHLDWCSMQWSVTPIWHKESTKKKESLHELSQKFNALHIVINAYSIIIITNQPTNSMEIALITCWNHSQPDNATKVLYSWWLCVCMHVFVYVINSLCFCCYCCCFVQELFLQYKRILFG